jgi:hypothetical protein
MGSGHSVWEWVQRTSMNRAAAGGGEKGGRAAAAGSRKGSRKKPLLAPRARRRGHRRSSVAGRPCARMGIAGEGEANGARHLLRCRLKAKRFCNQRPVLPRIRGVRAAELVPVDVGVRFGCWCLTCLGSCSYPMSWGHNAEYLTQAALGSLQRSCTVAPRGLLLLLYSRRSSTAASVAVAAKALQLRDARAG